MASEMLLQRSLGGLKAIDAVGQDILSSIGRNEIVKCTIRRPRNTKHHRKFFVLLKVVFENQSIYPTMDQLLDAVKLAIGHYDTRKIGNKEITELRSINFSSMDQTAFEQFYDRVVQLILTKILPGTAQADLEEQVIEIITNHGGHYV